MKEATGDFDGGDDTTSVYVFQMICLCENVKVRLGGSPSAPGPLVFL